MAGVSQLLLKQGIQYGGESGCPEDKLTNFLVVPKQKVAVRTSRQVLISSPDATCCMANGKRTSSGHTQFD